MVIGRFEAGNLPEHLRVEVNGSHPKPPESLLATFSPDPPRGADYLPKPSGRLPLSTNPEQQARLTTDEYLTA